jgi:hypothetical protein
MVEAASTVGVPRVVMQGAPEGINHCVVGRSIVASDTQTLATSKYYILLFKLWILTLLDIPKSSRTFANATAKLTPECDSATSTKSNRIHIGSPLFSKWVVIAMNALWLGDVHASVAKLSAPLCSFEVSI